MKTSLIITSLAILSFASCASTHETTLKISGKNFNSNHHIEISDKTKLNLFFKDSNDKGFNLSLGYKKLPKNRSFPSNIDLLITDSQGKKLSYLFFALNELRFLSQIGEWGIVTRINGKLANFKFSDSTPLKRNLSLASLDNERFIQDTLMPQKNFQMIRPVIMEQVNSSQLSKGFDLDRHPYYVEYKAIQKEDGIVEFQHNLYRKIRKKQELINRIYFHSGNLKTIRLAMYAGKYFSAKDGPIKLVFYPALGQTEPQN